MANRGYYEEYTLDELVDFYPKYSETIRSLRPEKLMEENISNDDRFSSKTWTQAYKFAAYYYDNPTFTDRNFYMNKFRLHFANILKKTASQDELPDMRSRKDFVAWVCKKHNEFLEKEEGNFRVDCNVEKLVESYGPNYQNVKSVIAEKDYFY
jgi:hypothetical protein